MANDTTLLSTVSSVLEDAVTPNDSNSSELSEYLTSNLWRYGWPPLCMTGLVGNTLVLLVLRRDGLVRTSANVYLSALAVGDSLVLIFTSLAVYPGLGWGLWLDNMSALACHALLPINHTLALCSVWIIVAFTVERCVVVRFPLLKLRLCTPRNAGLCCVSLLVLAFVKNVDVFIMSKLTITDGLGGILCNISMRHQVYRTWISLVVSSVIPTCVVLVCNWAIIRALRRKLLQTAAQDSVTRTTFMCLGVSFAFILCVVPANVFALVYINFKSWLDALPSPYDIWRSLVFLRYANHAINIFLYSLTGAHFRCELVAVFRSCLQRRRAVAAVRRLSSCVESNVQFRRGFDEDIEMC